jgi:mono/diheme cytochrome c family protein/uncharacterized membrane protein
MKDRTKAFSLGLGCSAGLALVILLAGFGLSQLDGARGGWLAFIGRLHPVVLHLPIGLLAGYLLLLIGQGRRHEPSDKLASDLLLAGTALSGAIAAAAGFLLATEGGYNTEILGAHKIQASVFTLAILLALVIRAQERHKPNGLWSVGHGLALTVAICFSVSAGHLGGVLTHGSSYLTEFAPTWLRPTAPDQTGVNQSEHANSDNTTTGTLTVMEIFEAHCFQCHGPEKQKGGYRMDVPESLLAGGESDLTAIVPWQPMNSYLVELITLPSEEDGVMPPAGKGELSEKTIMQIIHWIAEGAQL